MQERLVSLGIAIADGADVDWNSSLPDSTPGEQHVIEELRVLQKIARSHAQAPPVRARSRERATATTPLSWGRLTILGTIGSGTYGTVYRAPHPQRARRGALRSLHARG